MSQAHSYKILSFWFLNYYFLSNVEYTELVQLKIWVFFFLFFSASLPTVYTFWDLSSWKWLNPNTSKRCTNKTMRNECLERKPSLCLCRMNKARSPPLFQLVKDRITRCFLPNREVIQLGLGTNIRKQQKAEKSRTGAPESSAVWDAAQNTCYFQVKQRSPVCRTRGGNGSTVCETHRLYVLLNSINVSASPAMRVRDFLSWQGKWWTFHTLLRKVNL